MVTMKKYFLLFFLFCACAIQAKQPDLTPEILTKKMKEIMKAHASYKEMSPVIAERSLTNFIEELDPTKTYFIETDIDPWIHPSDHILSHVLEDYDQNKFTIYNDIYQKMLEAIARRKHLDNIVKEAELPKHVNAEEFKKLEWAKDEQELIQRLIKVRALQLEAANKLNNEDLKEKSLLRIEKRRAKYEEDLESKDPAKHDPLFYSKVLKALASSLDAHTAYFTPEEASQFMINVQQRLFGIGAQLRDDINGFTVVKIVEGGPAAKSKLLKLKDKIIAVNGEPVVGMDIVDAVELIRGEENSVVTLRVIREVEDKSGKHEETLEVPLVRGEVVLKESRYEASYEPYGDGIIAYLKLFSFYQDPESSSASDLTKELQKLKEGHKVKGVILDLRNNSGGLLTQAVEVAGLFITKGIVVAIKNENGEIQYLRDIDGKTIWNGPLIVLINRASASASEIVAQTLQDYGRALIVGDDHSFGKGSFQTFTLSSSTGNVNPEGEYKVTRGRYYTVSGKTPQLIGVQSDIEVPGLLIDSEVGEKYAKYPLESDSIKANFEDDLSDIPRSQRDKISALYRFNLQKRLNTYQEYLDMLKKNSSHRVDMDINYQNFLAELKKKDKDIFEEESESKYGQNDLQLIEAYNIMQDLLFLMNMESAKPKQTQGREKSILIPPAA